jgi:hypothetical protein
VGRRETMVVGRTLWDFVIEMMETPALRLWLLALVIVLEFIFIIIFILVQAGFLSLNLNYGGLGIEIRPLADSMAVAHQF